MSNSILSIECSNFGGGLLAKVTIKPEYVEQYFCVFVNGVYIQAVYAATETFTCALPTRPGNTSNSIYIEEAGYAQPDDTTIETLQANAMAQDATSANRISLRWSATYTGPVMYEGGTTPQVSNVTLTGVSRGKNCFVDLAAPQRGVLYYTLERILA